MRRLIAIVLLFLPCSIIAQSWKTAPVLSDHKALTRSLISNCKTDSARAFVIFRWITEHIEYDVALFESKGDYRSSLPEQPPNMDMPAFMAWYDDQVANMVLKNRKGICDGYSRLFKVMCNDAGLECKIIEGYGKTQDSIGLIFAPNHAWNAVKYNDSWHLVDATWSSGYVSNSSFTKRYNPYYYNTPPDYFIDNHYPGNVKDAFLPNVISLRSFFSGPLILPYFHQSSIVSFTPTRGRIEQISDTICFRITFRDSVRSVTIMEEPGDSLVGYWDARYVQEPLLPADHAPEKKPVKIDFKISRQEKERNEAMLAYVNSLEENNIAGKDSVASQPQQSLPGEAALSDDEGDGFLNCKIEGTTLIFKYHSTAKYTRQINFFVDDNEVFCYQVVRPQ